MAPTTDKPAFTVSAPDRETVAAGRGAEPGGRERLLRYVEVLREELGRLHRGMEAFLALSTARDDRRQSFDLREPVGDLALVLAGPARKRQVKVAADLPAHPVNLEGNRYQLRQALLQVGLAALAEAGRGQTLELALSTGDGRDGRTTLWIGATGEAAPYGEGEAPAGDLAAGSPELARLLLAGQGARLRGERQGYEIEWPFAAHG
jgi:hypothetical protein